jgi:hypothetical protein
MVFDRDGYDHITHYRAVRIALMSEPFLHSILLLIIPFHRINTQFRTV